MEEISMSALGAIDLKCVQFAWLPYSRGLVRDYERPTSTAEAVIQASVSRLCSVDWLARTPDSVLKQSSVRP